MSRKPEICPDVKMNTPNEEERCGTPPIAEYDDHNKFHIFLVIGFSIVGLAILASIYVNWSPKPINCNLTQLQQDFPAQDEYLWKAIKIGIETTLNTIENPKPSIFLFVSNDTKTMTSFAKNLTKIASICFNTNNALILNNTVLSSPELQDDYTKAFSKYGPQLVENRVMLVSDVNLIPASVAQMFIVFCDIQTPMAPRSVVFMTMTITNLPLKSIADHQLLNTMEIYLTDTWKSLKNNILKPLLSRVTDQVLFVKSEN